MSKDNLFSKKLKKQVLSINSSLENYFYLLKLLVLRIKKSKFNPNSKAFVFFIIVLITIFTIFSIPSFYDKKIIQSKIKNQILKKYNIEVDFNNKINFGLLPKPHFVSTNFSILKNQKDVAKVGKIKVFISKEKYFVFNDVKIKDLIFDKAEFDLNEKNLDFFKKLLSTNPDKDKIVIKNSKIFYKDLSGDVLFISKIFNSEFFYDFKKLENNLISKNEIFNLPFTIEIQNNYFDKSLSSKVESKRLRLGIINKLMYGKQEKNGQADIKLINKNTKVNYRINKDSLNFSSNVEKFYNGKIDFKPFYLFTNLNYNNLNFKNFVNNKPILVELIRSEIFNNENLNIDIKFNVKNILNADHFNNLNLNVGIIEGNINFSNSRIMWKNDLEIFFDDCFLDIKDNEINLVGKLTYKFNQIDNFYSFYQVKKVYRKEIENIEIDFVYDLIENNFSLYNAKIDDNLNENLEMLIEKFNNKDKRNFNKITFKNFINNFFKAYAG